MPLNVGQRVSRRLEIGEPYKRFGVVEKVEMIPLINLHSEIPRYTVKWDDGEVDGGYLACSLIPEEK